MIRTDRNVTNITVRVVITNQSLITQEIEVSTVLEEYLTKIKPLEKLAKE